LFVTGYALIFEQPRQLAARERQQADSIRRGVASYATLCYPCHGASGEGAVVPGVEPPRVAPPLNRPDFQVLAQDADEQRRVYDLISKTIHRGRPNTPMPAWGRLDGGTLLDEQIHELTLMIMNGNRTLSAEIEVQPEPGVHEFEHISGTPWQIASAQLAERFAEGAPTPIPASSLVGGGDSPHAAGQQALVKYGCIGCHTIEGLPGAAGTTGPNLSHIGTDAANRKPGTSAEDYLRESIHEPTAYVVEGFQPVMPKLPVTDEETAAIVEYLMSLK
jgi:mono/diheme cytochrome c family protein